MGWFDKIKALRLTTEPRYPVASRSFIPSRTLAGVRITSDNAMQNTAVMACVNYIQQSVGMMPWRAVQETEGGVVIRATHQVDKLLYRRPNPEMSSFQFRETLLNWALLYGNGFAEIEWSDNGHPFAMWPIAPGRVQVCRDTETGALFYEVDSEGGAKVEIAASDMFHIRGFGHGPVGVNFIEQAAQTLGWAQASTLFGASFFGNGMNLAGVVVNKKALSPPALKIQKAEFEQLYRGPNNANKTAFLDNDAEWKPIGIDPSKSQLVDLQHYLVEAVCRIFGVPPHIVAELSRSTNNNIEHQGIEAVVRCLNPWVVRFEDEADFKLFPNNRQRFRTEMDMTELLRGDFKSQAEGFQIYRNMGVVNTDEIREKLGLNRLTKGLGGEKYTMQMGFTELKKIGEEPPKPAAPPTVPETNDMPDDAETEAANQAADRVRALLEPVNV